LSDKIFYNSISSLDLDTKLLKMGSYRFGLPRLEVLHKVISPSLTPIILGMYMTLPWISMI